MRADLGFTQDNGIIRCDALSEFDFIRHGFTTRFGGVSVDDRYSSCNLGLSTEDSRENVVKNYKSAAERIGFDEKRLVLTEQVHGDKIKPVTENDCGKRLFIETDIKRTDGLITNVKNVPLGVFSADCTPILLLDTKKRAVGAVHSGWRGTLLEIGKNAVKNMAREYGSEPNDIVAVIGPSIKRCHFEVKQDVYDLFLEKMGSDLTERASIKKGESYYIDTDLINKESLMSCGVLSENIHICPRCTFCESDMFFSHRKSGGKTGRQCAFITLA